MMSRKFCIWFAVLPLTGGTMLRAEVPPLPENQRIPVAEATSFPVPEKSPMQLPTDVAVDREGNVYVADGVNQRIVIFSSQGQWKDIIENIAERRLDNPVGLTMDNRNRLWITDTGHPSLIVLDEESRKKKEGGRWIELPPSAKDHPCDPTDVAVTRDGERIWVVDNDHHRLMYRGTDDAQWTVMGGPGTGLGQFEWPYMLALGPGGDLYVTEAIGARVQHVRPDLRWGGQIGFWGIRPGELYRPKGLVVDGNNNVYVSDSTTWVVQVFRTDGELEGVLCATDGRPYRFQHPMGMAFDDKAHLYVVEMLRNTVTKVTLAHPPATQPGSPGENEEGLK